MEDETVGRLGSEWRRDGSGVVVAIGRYELLIDSPIQDEERVRSGARRLGFDLRDGRAG